MTPLLENKNAIVYGGAAPWAARSPVRSQAGGEGLPRRPVVQPGSDGLRVKPGIQSRTGRDLKHCTGTIQSHQSNETE